MIIRPAPTQYDAREEQDFREEVRRADRENLKRGQDIVLQPGQRIIMASATKWWAVSIDDDGLWVMEEITP